MARYPSSSGASYSFGPGGMTPAVKLLIITNVVMFVLNLIVPAMTLRLGLEPRAVFEEFAFWQPFTYMFLHSTSGVGHVLINMLSLWMFGTELERTWGTRFFTKYLLRHRRRRGGDQPAAVAVRRQHLLLGYGRRVGCDLRIAARLRDVLSRTGRFTSISFSRFPAKYFVMIVGAIAFFSALAGPGGGIAHAAHLGGLIVGYLYLKGLRARPMDELEVPVAAVENGPRPQQVRCLFRRPLIRG